MSRTVVIDTETTGKSLTSGNHRVVEIACVELIDGKITGNKYLTRLNPDGKKSTKGALAKHHISDEALLVEPTFRDIHQNLLKFIDGAELAFYNAKFDIFFIQKELRLAESTIQLDRDFQIRCLMLETMGCLRLENPIKLEAACSRYHVDTTGEILHSALGDATLTAKLLLEIESGVVPLDRTPQKNKHQPQVRFPFSRAFQGIQLNFCKNPLCINYGRPPDFPCKTSKGSYKKGLNYGYKIVTSRDGGSRSLYCSECKTSTTLINNRAFVAEKERVESLYITSYPACPNTGLYPDAKKNIADGRRYQKIVKKVRGKTREFNRLLKECPNSQLGLIDNQDLYILEGRKHKENTPKPNKPLILHPRDNHELIAGKMDINDFDSQVIRCKQCSTKFNVKLNPQKGQQYSQLNHQLFFNLVNHAPINRMVEKLSIHPQTIYDRIDFIYRQCIEFDQYQISKHSESLSRREFNLSVDRMLFYTKWRYRKESPKEQLSNISLVDNGSRFAFASQLNFDATSDYRYILLQEAKLNEYDKPTDMKRYAQYIIGPESLSKGEPTAKHLKVQQTYSALAFFARIRGTLSKMGKVHLFSDDDAVIRLAACLTLRELISCGQLDYTQVKNSRFKDSPDEYSDDANQYGYYTLPITKTAAESCESANINGADNYFQLLRRRVKMLERPVLGASGKKWLGYAPQNPKHISKILEIARIYNNYILDDKVNLVKTGRYRNNNERTPAQKIGIAERAFTIDDILEFSAVRAAIQHRIQKAI